MSRLVNLTLKPKLIFDPFLEISEKILDARTILFPLKEKSRISIAQFLSVKVLKSALARSRPNVILLICDDFGIGDFQVYNKNSKVPTPNIDRLGNEGES